MSTFDLNLLSKSQVQHQHIPASLLCARASYKPPRAWPSSSKRFISHQFTPSSVWFFLSLFPCLFFLFWKRKYGFIKAQGLSITLYRALFLSINLPDFFFFHLVQWTGYQIMAANASRHKPSPLFSNIQNNDISPSHPLRSSRALVPTECLLYGDPFISHTASLPPENIPVYAITPQTQTQNSPNREREANGLYFSFLRVNRLVIYHGINMPDMFMKAVISRSKKFPKES